MAHVPHALLRLLDASQLQACQAARLVRRRAVAHVVGGRHLDERLQFVVQLGLGVVPGDQRAHE
jgi:hypothetical protein